MILPIDQVVFVRLRAELIRLRTRDLLHQRLQIESRVDEILRQRIQQPSVRGLKRPRRRRRIIGIEPRRIELIDRLISTNFWLRRIPMFINSALFFWMMSLLLRTNIGQPAVPSNTNFGK